jgi:hypothetical protein
MSGENFPEVPVDVLIAKYETKKAQETDPAAIEKYGRYINVLRTLVMFLNKNSTKFETIDKLPVIDGEVLHVSDLFMEIANRGGYHWKQEGQYIVRMNRNLRQCLELYFDILAKQ